MVNPVGAVVIVKLEAENILDQALKPDQAHIASDLSFGYWIPSCVLEGEKITQKQNTTFIWARAGETDQPIKHLLHKLRN